MATEKIEMIDPDEIEKSLRERFKATDAVKRRLLGNVERINADRDELLNKTMEQEVSEAYLIANFPEYSTFVPVGADKKSEFIRGKNPDGTYHITMDQKLSIIAAHRNVSQIYTGSDKFSADLSDTQKIKAERKQRYKKDAEDLMADYKKILEDSQNGIATIEAEIQTRRNEIAQVEASITKLLEIGASEDTLMNGSSTRMKKVDQKDVNAQKQKLEAQKRRIEKEIADLQNKLNRLREIHNKCVTDLAKRKDEVTAMLEKGKIFSGAEQQGTIEEKDKADNEKSSALTTNASNKPKDIAKSMLKDFFDRSPEEQRTILAQCGSKDLLNATNYLGVMQRRRLARVLEERIEEMDGDIQFTGKNGMVQTITKDELLGNKLTKDQLRAIAEEIDEFNQNFDKKDLDEITAFEDKIQYIRYATYRQETGWFRNITRHFDALRRNSNNFKIGEISRTLARYATIKNERERNQVTQLNKWRQTLKLKKVHDLAITNPRALDRTGQDSILRQDYHEEEL